MVTFSPETILDLFSAVEVSQKPFFSILNVDVVYAGKLFNKPLTLYFIARKVNFLNVFSFLRHDAKSWLFADEKAFDAVKLRIHNCVYWTFIFYAIDTEP